MMFLYDGDGWTDGSMNEMDDATTTSGAYTAEPLHTLSLLFLSDSIGWRFEPCGKKCLGKL